MAANKQCAYRNPIYGSYGRGFRHNGSDQCWITNERTTFYVEETCMLHLSAEERFGRHAPAYEGSFRQAQAAFLKTLILEWIEECQQSSVRSKFVIVGFECGGLNLEGLVLPGDFICCDSVLLGDFHAKSTRFRGLADFRNVRFKGTVNLDFAQFDDSLVLVDAKFETDFHLRARSIHCLELGRTLFSHPSDITDVSILNFNYSTHSGARLQISACSSDPEGCWNFFDCDCSKLAFLNQDLTRARFLGADIRDTRFENCAWASGIDQRPYAHVFDETLVDEDSDLELMVREERKLGGLYRQLKKNYEDNHDFRQAGDFHFREMWIREQILSNQSEISWREKVDRGLLRIYRWAADYGESVSKLAFWNSVVILSASLGVSVSQGVEAIWEGHASLCSHAQCIWNAVWNFGAGFKMATLSLIPLPFHRQLLEKVPLNWVSQSVLGVEAIALLGLVPLLVMAMRRRLRR